MILDFRFPCSFCPSFPFSIVNVIGKYIISTGSENARPLMVPIAMFFQKGLISPMRKGINPSRVEAMVRNIGTILALYAFR